MDAGDDPPDGPERAERRARLEQVFLSWRPMIESAVGAVARRNRLTTTEREDFLSRVNVALIEDDYAIVGRFQGRSSPRTYLVTVVQRILIDDQRKQLGRWNPSARAKRLGPLAVKLEMLLFRDGLSFDEAADRLCRDGTPKCREELRALCARLKPRQRVKLEGEVDLERLPAGPGGDPYERLSRTERAQRIEASLQRAYDALEAEDRLVLLMHFEASITVANISRSLGLDQKQLYRRMETILARMRASLEADGLTWDDVKDAIEAGDIDFWPFPRKNGKPGPPGDEDGSPPPENGGAPPTNPLVKP